MRRIPDSSNRNDVRSRRQCCCGECVIYAIHAEKEDLNPTSMLKQHLRHPQIESSIRIPWLKYLQTGMLLYCKMAFSQYYYAFFAFILLLASGGGVSSGNVCS